MKNKIQVEDKVLTIQNYKEPLVKIPKDKGFGFWGTLLVSENGEDVQCHICGKLFSDLNAHIQMGHKWKAADYKEHFKLARTTALISEERRMQLKEGMLNMLKAMTPEQKLKAIENMKKARKRINTKGYTIRLETDNKRGTCPDQLLDKIKKVAKKMGRTPTSKEFVVECGTSRYKHFIFKVFGSWNKAIEMTKLTKHKARTTKGKILRTDEELITYLQDYTLSNKKLPTASDFNRGLLPPYSTYLRHFGTISVARNRAGLNEILDDMGVKTTLGRWK